MAVAPHPRDRQEVFDATRARLPCAAGKQKSPHVSPPSVAACPRCYAVLPYGATTCPSCGTAVGPLPSMPVPSVAPSPASGARFAPAPAGAFGASLPPVPSLPLYPGESVIARYTSSPAGSARVIRLNMLVVLGVVLVVLLPLGLLGLFQAPGPTAIILFLPLLLVGGMLGYASIVAGKRPPTVLFLTDRRAIVEHYGTNASSAGMGLENLGDVRADQNNWASRRAGVVWVYLLPLGTTRPLVGGGRNRHAAPGVIWVPAMPVAQAQELRDRLLRTARELQAKMGYPMAPGNPTFPAPPPGYSPPPGYAPAGRSPPPGTPPPPPPPPPM